MCGCVVSSPSDLLINLPKLRRKRISGKLAIVPSEMAELIGKHFPVPISGAKTCTQ